MSSLRHLFESVQVKFYLDIDAAGGVYQENMV